MALELTGENIKQTMKATASPAGPGGISGTVTFTEFELGSGRYVKVEADIKGDPTILTPGKHAFHIHEKAACDCEGFKCAGGHFDPGLSGNTDPDANHGYHAGDLPNLIVDVNGHGTLEAISTRFTLSDGPVSILDKDSAPEGTSVMIHAKEDPHTPGESGSGWSGGTRLACGTIEKA